MQTIKLWTFLLRYLSDDTGSLSLTGDNPDPGGTGGDGGSPDPVLGDAPPEPGSTDPDSGGQGPESFLSALPDEIKEDPSLKVFIDDKGNVNLGNLAKSYVHAQKKVGEKGIILPTEKSTPEEWAQFYNQVRPDAIDKYEVRNSLEDGTTLDEDLFNGFKQTAHEAGLSTTQAQRVVDWFNKLSNTSETQLQEQTKQNYDKEVETLKSDWGEGFQKEFSLASRAIKEFASEEELTYLKESGLDGNVKLIRLFNKIGKGLLEDKFDDTNHGTFGMTPEDAARKMNAIYGDVNHPYWKEGHAQHKDAVDEMSRLTEASMANRG